jgi:hypothetical protein
MYYLQMLVRRASLVLLVASLPAAAGCDANGGKPQTGKTDQTERQFRFEPTEEPQHVVFLTESWTGGGGDPVLTGPDAKGTLQYKGDPVYVQTKAKQQIGSRLGPQPPGNRDGRILVEAKVRLEPATATVSTNPPSERSLYRVVIDELIHAEWYMP